MLRSSQLGALICAVALNAAWPVRAEKIIAQGITEPIFDSTLGAPVAGIVDVHKYKEGDFVKKGEAIIELDKRLEELETERRKVVLPTLKTDLDGTRHLYETTKSVSKEALNKKETEYNVAVVEHKLAEEQVRKRLILAPFDGFVAQIFLEPGEACEIQQPIARIVDTRRCYFISNIEAKTGHNLKVGQPVNLEIESGPGTVAIPGKVSFVSPVVDAASGLMRIKVVFDNAEGKVRPGVAGKMIIEE